MTSPTLAAAVQDIKAAADKLAAASSLPVEPSALDFHHLHNALRDYAKASDFLFGLCIARADVASTVDFTDETHIVKDALDNLDVFASLNKAADEAEERNTPARSIFTGRRTALQVRP